VAVEQNYDTVVYDMVVISSGLVVFQFHFVLV